MGKDNFLTKRIVTHTEAQDILHRFIASHFRDGREHARFSIPAKPDYDDDLVLSAYIKQQKSRDDRPAEMLQWATDVFGPVARVPSERALRFLEEAIETAHAFGVDRAVIPLLIERVYTRPAGERQQEIGQALMCLECLAEVMGISADAACDLERKRLHESDIEERRARHRAKVDAGIATSDVMAKDASPTGESK